MEDYERKDDGTYQNPLVQDVFKKVKILQENAKLLEIEIDDQTALAEVLYKDSVPSYQGDNLKYLTQVAPDDPSLDLAEFELAMESGNIEEMTRIAEQNKSLNIHIYNKQMEDIAVVKEGLEGGDTIPPKTDTTPTTDNVGKRPDDPVQGRRWDNKYGGKYDPETGDKLPEKEKKLPPRMEQNK